MPESVDHRLARGLGSRGDYSEYPDGLRRATVELTKWDWSLIVRALTDGGHVTGRDRARISAAITEQAKPPGPPVLQRGL